MTEISYEDNCCKCGRIIYILIDYRPYPNCTGECLDCGYNFFTLIEQRSLEQVNKIREEYGLSIIKCLKSIKRDKSFKINDAKNKNLP